jgi:hypothetical protein
VLPGNISNCPADLPDRSFYPAVSPQRHPDLLHCPITPLSARWHSPTQLSLRFPPLQHHPEHPLPPSNTFICSVAFPDRPSPLFPPLQHHPEHPVLPGDLLAGAVRVDGRQVLLVLPLHVPHALSLHLLRYHGDSHHAQRAARAGHLGALLLPVEPLLRIHHPAPGEFFQKGRLSVVSDWGCI